MSKFLDLDGLRYFFTKIRSQFDSRYYKQEQIDTMLSGKSDTSHNHDSRYYTESEIDTKLSGKANSSHTHDDRYYTESEMDTKLSGKANSSHTHTKSQITDFSHTHDDRYYTESEMDTKLSAKANLASPTFTGTPKAPTASKDAHSTQIATTAFVTNQMALIKKDFNPEGSGWTSQWRGTFVISSKVSNEGIATINLIFTPSTDFHGGTVMAEGLPTPAVNTYSPAIAADKTVASLYVNTSGRLLASHQLESDKQYRWSITYYCTNADYYE